MVKSKGAAYNCRVVEFIFCCVRLKHQQTFAWGSLLCALTIQFIIAVSIVFYEKT